VFDPFFIRTDGPPDFGLNLMGVYFLVYHLGGHISGSNSEGAGVNFHIELPVQAVEKASATATSREFVTNVLMNDSLWERLLPHE
jgi:K+-sensing histidine kinase KdpD